ncbi:DUF2218 domain-containing protein [Lichenihabitans psoromatis]|uniref:DUF2218 domain-containing protein n=1 Tax=Lichenihabitans psoromatis TaxID=2528642 RepID=UPI001035AD13|nr:DUF2218 domain-containing protein [Lichenihabitans psoromatis]
MSTFTAEVETEHASRYLQQLCKHWSHKFTVTFDPSRGTIDLNGSTCSFVAEPHRLLMSLANEDAAVLPRLCEVVTEHLKRFAFREELAVEWAEAV